MAYCEDFWIERIYIIVEKYEKEDFSFTNVCRAWHGFVYCIEGSGVFIDSMKNKYPFRKGDVVLLDRGSNYTIKMSGTCRYVTTAFEMSFLGQNDVFPKVLATSLEEQTLIKEACEAFEQKSKNGLSACRKLLIDLYAAFFADLDKNETMNTKLDFAQKAARFIQATFKENLTVVEIAKHCQIGESYLRSIFLKEFGEPITKYRENLRVREAKNMLRSGLFSNGEIAEKLGYCDVYHFCKNFKQATGVPPGKYKKSLYTKK